ncbi:MAG: M42 family peptidase, partial [Clostridia bacterium]|nr:M42 family peptidase [Clostridia bacterium]
MLGRAVTVGEKKINGVIGLKPIHMTKGDEKMAMPEKMYIDIGAADKKEAEKYVSIGDSAYFISDFELFGENKVKSKALDDRFGCSVMIDMIENGIDYDAWFAFLVQEEVGLRGASAAAYTIEPDYAIVLEATTAADVAGVKKEDCVCALSKGAVVSFMDRSTVYNRELFKRAFELAGENNIPCQTKTTVAGGNDAGAIHKSGKGVYTLTVSLPCRYIHSATSVADIRDMAACKEMAKVLLSEFANA